MLCTTSSLSLSDAMKLAGYKKKEISIHWVRQAISKKKSRLVIKNEINSLPPQTSVSFCNRSAKTKLSDITNSTDASMEMSVQNANSTAKS